MKPVGGGTSRPRFCIMQESPALLIDARNVLYRAIFAVKADKRNYVKYHYFTVFLRQITSWMNKYRPSSVHIFWDAPRNTIWRKKIYETYKDRTGSSYVEDISEDLRKTTAIAKAFFNHMGVRQYSKKEMEADDLIYAAVTMIHPSKTIIVSTDSDMIQIPYTFHSCCVYNPFKNEEVCLPDINPVIQKAIVGDKSDSIIGYYGIGPKKSATLISESGKLEEFFNANGRSTFVRNMLLIDLSLNPKLLHNKLYCQKQLQTAICFNDAEIKKLINKYKINGMLQEYADLVPPFKRLQSQ